MVTNDQAAAQTVEMRAAVDATPAGASDRLVKRDGWMLWAVHDPGQRQPPQLRYGVGD